MHLRRSGYIFSQVGGAFLVHYPHRESASKKLWAKKSGVKRDTVDAIFNHFSSWLLTLPDKQRLHLCPPSHATTAAAMRTVPTSQAQAPS
jgi:hypothetical protein